MLSCLRNCTHIFIHLNLDFRLRIRSDTVPFICHGRSVAIVNGDWRAMSDDKIIFAVGLEITYTVRYYVLNGLNE